MGRSAGAILAQAAGQALNSAGALLRIPILASYFGAAVYGHMVLYLAIVPWILLAASGHRASVRTRVAEEMSSGGLSLAGHAHLRSHLVGARRVRNVILLLLVAVIGLAVVFVDREDLLLVSLASGTIALSAIAFPGIVWTGALEGSGNAVFVNLSLGLSSLLGVPSVLLLILIDAGFEAILLTSVLAVVAPYLAAGVRGPRVLPGLKKAWRGATWPSDSKAMTVGAFAILLANGLDPFIIAFYSSVDAVAAYSLASRLAILVTVVPTGLSPVLWSRFAWARVRDPRQVVSLLRRTMMQAWLFGIVAGSAFALIGPKLGQVVGANEIATPQGLYVAIAALGALQFPQVVWLAALSTHQGSRFVARTVLYSACANIVGSVYLAQWLGAVGPPLASTIGAMVLVCSYWIFSRRHPEALRGDRS